jgi:hypothetical protein
MNKNIEIKFYSKSLAAAYAEAAATQASFKVAQATLFESEAALDVRAAESAVEAAVEAAAEATRDVRAAEAAAEAQESAKLAAVRDEIQCRLEWESRRAKLEHAKAEAEAAFAVLAHARKALQS